MKKIFLIIALIISPALSFAEPERGKEIYMKYCSWCHGDEGAGDGPAAPFLNPPPRDFTYGQYKWKSTPFGEDAPSDKDFHRMIAGREKGDRTGWDGMGGTAMPWWGDVLTEEEVREVTAHIKALSFIDGPRKGAVIEGRVKPAPEGIERGRKLYLDRCSECHGELGRGDAAKKLKDDFGERTWPRNLTKGWTFRTSRSPEDIYERISIGVPGTQMPSFEDPGNEKRLTEAERWDAANYVSTLEEPYKRPGKSPVLRSRRIRGELPGDPGDPEWQEEGFVTFRLVPQIISGERLFKPSVDSVSIKSLYNDREIAILLEWDDPTESIPGSEGAMKLADGEVFRDAAAVEFPSGASGRTPYFGMGSAGLPVNIWLWKGPPGEGLPGEAVEISAEGFKDMERMPSGNLTARGSYDRGTWRVVMKRTLTAESRGGIEFREGVFIPAAFAAWDGSNGEKGSRHTLTAWYWLYLEGVTGAEVYLWPIIVGSALFAGEVALLVLVRGKG